MANQKTRLEIIENISANLLDWLDQEHKKDYYAKIHDPAYFHIKNKLDTILGVALNTYDEFDYNNMLDMEKKVSSGKVK